MAASDAPFHLFRSKLSVIERHLMQWRPPDIAEDIARELRTSDADAEQARCQALRQLDQRRQSVTGKLNRGYDDFVEGRISQDFWNRRSAEWEAELQTIEASGRGFSSRRS